MANRKVYREGEYDALFFEKLPPRCKEIFFEYLNYGMTHDNINKADAFVETIGFYIKEECKSPIEMIFDFAFSIVDFMYEGHRDCPGIYLEPQHSIKLGHKKYRVDFYYDSNYPDDDCKYRGKNPLKLVIECDGHEFHEKTKQQVIANNERDFQLKMAGYDVLHFSGSQIFNEPLQCAMEVYEYIQKQVGEWIEKGE